MITNSGILVMPDNDKCPSIEDVALSLGRQPRFGGHTNRWWPVLLHSFVCYQITAERTSNKRLLLYALWHDGHESVTCDVPTTWKTGETKTQQRNLDVRIWAMLGVSAPTAEENGLICLADQAAAYAEGYLVGPPGISNWFGATDPKTLKLHPVREVMRRFPSPQSTNGVRSKGVRYFMNLTEMLLDHG